MNNISKKKRKKSVNVAIKSVQNIQKFIPNPKTTNGYTTALFEKDKRDRDSRNKILDNIQTKSGKRTVRVADTSKKSGQVIRQRK